MWSVLYEGSPREPSRASLSWEPGDVIFATVRDKEGELRTLLRLEDGVATWDEVGSLNSMGTIASHPRGTLAGNTRGRVFQHRNGWVDLGLPPIGDTVSAFAPYAQGFVYVNRVGDIGQFAEGLEYCPAAVSVPVPRDRVRFLASHKAILVLSLKELATPEVVVLSPE